VNLAVIYVSEYDAVAFIDKASFANIKMNRALPILQANVFSCSYMSPFKNFETELTWNLFLLRTRMNLTSLNEMSCLLSKRC
jgi:hypothetical protein